MEISGAIIAVLLITNIGTLLYIVKQEKKHLAEITKMKKSVKTFDNSGLFNAIVETINKYLEENSKETEK